MSPIYEHTDKQFEADLRNLREQLLLMGGKVEEMIVLATRSLVERDSGLAQSVANSDLEVDQMEIAIDDLCLRIFALWQPAASDLRFVTRALKIVTDLERIGDECTNIAERALELNEVPKLKPFLDLPRMADLARDMVRQALDAFVEGDVDKALDVCKRDDVIDELYVQIFRELVSYMVEDVRTISRATALISVAKYMERVGDHATNIAEMVVFMVKGSDIRHPRSRAALGDAADS